MRKKIAAGNWKMNTSLEAGINLAKEIASETIPKDVEVILATPFTHLKTVNDQFGQVDRLFIAAQNCSTAESGAYTGEVSASMLKSIGISHVLIGHSERRAYFHEDADILNAKLAQAFANNLTPIYCCGEPLGIRQAKTHESYVQDQLAKTIFKLTAEEFSKIVIAYEPIWAIGTGETASPEQAQSMHAAIRKMISEKYGDTIANSTPILYGGSVKPANAKDIFAKQDVDGGLVGGASLKAETFVPIINSFE